MSGNEYESCRNIAIQHEGFVQILNTFFVMNKLNDKYILNILKYLLCHLPCRTVYIYLRPSSIVTRS